MTAMFELVAGIRNLEELLLDPSMEADVAMIQQAIDGVNADIETKCANGVGLLHSMDAQLDAIDKEIKRFQQMKKVITHRRDTVKDIYLQGLQALGKKKVQTKYGPMSVRANGGKASLEINDMLLPIEYTKQTITIEPDKDKIRAALEAGEQVPGCAIKERGCHLSY